MESVIFENSPVAQYLEGQGEAGDEWASAKTANRTPSPQTTSFAPRGLSSQFKCSRKRPPRLLNLDTLSSKGAVARIHDTCSSALHSRLGWTGNTHFLEQFRYTIVASQLLNEHSNSKSYKRQSFPPPTTDGSSRWDKEQSFAPSWQGLSLTIAAAFALAWSIRWFHNRSFARYSTTTVILFFSVFSVILTLLYYYFRRQWLHYLRVTAVESASLLIMSAQDFDVAVSAGITLIQEVELVSRGYNLSNPLPPITRLEETYQIKRCARLRRTIQRTLITMFAPYYSAYKTMKPLAVDLDLEKYYDIYEISRIDREDAELVANVNISEIEDADTLQDLKVGLQKLQVIRKLFLCTLLALDADGSKSDFQRWSIATENMNSVSSLTIKMIGSIDEAMGDEEEFKTPLTPKLPLTPSRERMRSQMRQFGNLSRGIRGLQAKMRLLRDESNITLDHPDEFLESGTNVLAQYDSIGADLKGLMQEWEEGRAALALSLDKKEHMRSLSSASNMIPASPTSSLGGTTAVGGGSPQDAFQALNGISKTRSRSSTTSSSGEEVFEAVALPRQRSTLTREERIAKMQEERMRQAIVKDKANANTHMLKELETFQHSKSKKLDISLQTLSLSHWKAIRKPLPEKSQNSVNMLEARLEQANLLKKVVDAIKDLVQDCNFDCNDSGVALQAMDNSHVALVSMMLKAESFSPFRCDRNIALGINLSSLMKVLRCAQNEDILTLKAEDAPDVVNLVFESSESDRLSEYDIKLMDIDQEHLGIPETEYSATITMPSAEFQRICRDLMALSESVAIEATKEGVKFSCSGDIGNGAVTLRSHTNVDKPELNVEIALSEPVALTFSLKYLVNFCKASGLSSTVKLCLSNEVPLLVEYTLASNSYLRFYLAPKIGDEE